MNFLMLPLKMLGLYRETFVEGQEIDLFPDSDYQGAMEPGMLVGQRFRLDGWPVEITGNTYLRVSVRSVPFWRLRNWRRR